MEIVELIRSYGVEVYHVSKAHDDDLHLIVKGDRGGWERALRALEKRGFDRNRVLKEEFTGFDMLMEMNRQMGSFYDWCGDMMGASERGSNGSRDRRSP